jgi:hypothetical protein
MEIRCRIGRVGPAMQVQNARRFLLWPAQDERCIKGNAVSARELQHSTI